MNRNWDLGQTKRFHGNSVTKCWVLFMVHLMTIKLQGFIKSITFVQGCVFACTAIEKYFKARILFEGKIYKLRHDIVKLYTKWQESSELLKGLLNDDFLHALHNIYELRYIGESKPGAHFTILKNKFLAELDLHF
jgi:hypothetical protein